MRGRCCEQPPRHQARYIPTTENPATFYFPATECPATISRGLGSSRVLQCRPGGRPIVGPDRAYAASCCTSNQNAYCLLPPDSVDPGYRSRKSPYCGGTYREARSSCPVHRIFLNIPWIASPILRQVLNEFCTHLCFSTDGSVKSTRLESHSTQKGAFNGYRRELHLVFVLRQGSRSSNGFMTSNGRGMLVDALANQGPRGVDSNPRRGCNLSEYNGCVFDSSLVYLQAHGR